MKLKTHEKAWLAENKIYSLLNIRLPIPIALTSLAYFSIICAMFLFIGKVLPVTANIPSPLRFVILPFLITNFLRKKKLDGKPPHIFLLGYIEFIASKNHNLEFFRVPKRQSKDIIKLNWNCTHRNT